MNQDFLKGRSANFNSISHDNFTNFNNIKRPLKLIPILRYKKVWEKHIEFYYNGIDDLIKIEYNIYI